MAGRVGAFSLVWWEVIENRQTSGAPLFHRLFSPWAAANAARPAVSGDAKRKVLYYRNPMGLPDISPVPKKDPMGMDYVPVYEGEEPAAASNQVAVSTEKVQKLEIGRAHV